MIKTVFLSCDYPSDKKIDDQINSWFGFCWAILSEKATPEKIKNNQKLTCREPRKKRTRNVKNGHVTLDERLPVFSQTHKGSRVF